MNSKQKRIDSVLRDLYEMHEELFGQKYTIGLAIDASSEFNRIIDEFRELVFTIKASQEERDMHENKKSFANTPDRVKINHEIREDISRADGILREAAKRLQSGDADPTIITNRQKVLKNCYNLLQDVKEVEDGGVYRPPEYPTLQQIKLELMGNQYREEHVSDHLDVDEEIAMDQYDDKDRQMDVVLDEIINVNANVRRNMEGANQAIDLTRQKIKRANKKAGGLITRVEKADRDLAEILKTYQRPSQFCLNIILVLLVLALIGVIISLVKGGTV